MTFLRWFRRPAPPTVELSTDAYARWLRAQRPPFEWFLGLPEIEQEALAGLGEEHVENVAVALGTAVRNPLAYAAAVLGEHDPDTADSIEELLAAQAGQKLAQAAPGQPLPSMGGHGERTARTNLANARADSAGCTLLGRAPDVPEGATG